ncbi:Uncharacterized protein FWK35_00009076 [Aphis craccivora]|uniref:Uncharacterized protein n=1 Tax=Aphis craccivora TaxID=307492 RepID=A0A6G0YLU5_APHCR|nr:Uncharacterized protein FWK35_00009076 [Aphis craccivora]
MPTFKIEGQIYHLIGSLLPKTGQSLKLLQIYFITEDIFFKNMSSSISFEFNRSHKILNGVMNVLILQ